MDLLNISRPWDCQVFPKSKTICYGGGGGGGDAETVVEVVSDTVSDNTPDIKVEPPPPIEEVVEDISDTISDNTPDIKIVEEDIITADEVLTKIDETGGAAGEFVKGGVKDTLTAGESVTDAIGEVTEGSDVDTFLEDSKDIGDLMLDTVITIATGEDHGKVKELKEKGQETQEAYQDLADDVQTGLDNLEDVATDTVTTTNQVLTDIGTNVVEQFSEAMGLTDETQGGAVTEGSRGGDVVRDEDLLQLGKKKSDLKAQKKKGKKGLRIDYGVSLPGSGKSGIAA